MWRPMELEMRMHRMLHLESAKSLSFAAGKKLISNLAVFHKLIIIWNRISYSVKFRYEQNYFKYSWHGHWLGQCYSGWPSILYFQKVCSFKFGFLWTDASMILFSNYVHRLSHLLCAVWILKTCTLLPNLKISDAWNFYRVILKYMNTRSITIPSKKISVCLKVLWSSMRLQLWESFSMVQRQQQLQALLNDMVTLLLIKTWQKQLRKHFEHASQWT